jgi:hypothetical protein
MILKESATVAKTTKIEDNQGQLVDNSCYYSQQNHPLKVKTELTLNGKDDIPALHLFSIDPLISRQRKLPIYKRKTCRFQSYLCRNFSIVC